jgi:hypothetical protein
MFGAELIKKLGIAGETWLNRWSALVAVRGAALFQVVYHALRGRLAVTERGHKLSFPDTKGQGKSSIKINLRYLVSLPLCD